jgi:2-polyprenyl-3-methyl-5-hydroxy-6-metoxy-1,4-benzoquinol methylase
MNKNWEKDVLQWDYLSWSVALRYWQKKVDWSSIHHALELGGRQGGLSLWLASKNIQVVCSDISNTQELALHWLRHGHQIT